MDRIVRTGTVRVQAPLEETLPLFTPLGEEAWVEGWSPEYVHPADGRPEVHAVFVTRHDAEETVWVTIEYDTERARAGYVNITPGVMVTRVDVACTPITPHETDVEVRYTRTALSDEGRTRLSVITERHFTEVMVTWQDAIAHYLATGERVLHA